MRLGGWILSGLVSAFLFFDAAGKILLLAAVKAGTAQAGFPIDELRRVGAALLVITVLYLVPRTAGLGGLLLTAYLGGAVVVGVRVHSPLFIDAFPIVFGVLVWVGLVLRDRRFRILLPLGE